MRTAKPKAPKANKAQGQPRGPGGRFAAKPKMPESAPDEADPRTHIERING